MIKITPSDNSSVQTEVQVKIQRKKDASHAWGPVFLGMSGNKWLGPSGQQEVEGSGSFMTLSTEQETRAVILERTCWKWC